MTITCATSKQSSVLKIVEIIYVYLDEENEKLKNLINQSFFTSRSIATHTSLWTQRPSWVKESISYAFQRISSNIESSSWGLFKGADQYCLCHVDEAQLVKLLIEKTSFSRKNYYVLDIGSGDFSWSRYLAEYINKQKDLSTDFTLHIIGTIGERSHRDEIEKCGKCILYNLSNFKVEDLISELHRFNLPIKEGELDLIVSNWCLRHLVDPVGTFLQALNLLRRDGIFLGNGFIFLQQKQSLEKYTDALLKNYNMINLLLNVGWPFIMSHNDHARGLNEFIIKRTTDTPCSLKMTYANLEPVDEHAQIAACAITRFKNAHRYRKPSKINSPLSYYSMNRHDFHGNRRLYSWLEKNELFNVKDQRWKPILKSKVVKSVKKHTQLPVGPSLNLDQAESSLALL